MDCIILAGNRESYREVSNKHNKAFLEIGGSTILEIIVKELARVDEIDRLLLVGPKAELDRCLEKIRVHYPKPIQVFEQKQDLVSNILSVAYASGSEDDPERYFLILPSDIPLIIAEEIHEFITKCDMDRYDYVGGLARESTLSRFYPDEKGPGVKMAYFYCQNQGYRINNLHMVRPSMVKNLEYIRKTYAIRYQKKFWNMVKVLFSLLRLAVKIPSALGFYPAMHMARMLEVKGWHRSAAYLSSFLKLSQLESYINRILDTRIKIITTSYGGSTIDVDNENDYRAIQQRFDEWVQMQRALVKDIE